MTGPIQLRLGGGDAWPVIVAGACERCATPFEGVEDRAPCPRCIDEVVSAWTSTGGSWTAATARAYRAAAEAFSAGDPFTQNGLFERVIITRFLDITRGTPAFGPDEV